MTRLVYAELSDGPNLETTLRETKPEWIFHLAGFAHPGDSFLNPEGCWSDNLNATQCLYDSVLRTGFSPRILFVSTGLVYGDPTGSGEPFTETSPLRPASPYAESKKAADLLGEKMARESGIDVVRVRPFNQIGPRQSADYAVANFARHVAAIERGSQPPVITPKGDLSAFRDLTDVRDMVRAYRLLIESGKRGEVYNAGSGTAYRIGDILNRLIQLSGMPIDVKQTAEPSRKASAGVARADTTKLRAATGWEPRYPFDETLKDVLTYWRAVSAPAAS
jgi:GDP-4-dehydro-6-deoxy-D-mannose reductase